MQIDVCFADGPLAGADGAATFSTKFTIGEVVRCQVGEKIHRYKVRDTPEARYVEKHQSPPPEGAITMDWSPFGVVG